MNMMSNRPMMPGIEAIQARFVTLLEERQTSIAHHALNAWDGTTVEEINGSLAAAQSTLHQIAGTAGSLGFAELGTSARACEIEIIAHLEGPDADLAICPVELISRLDKFVSDCRTLIDGQKGDAAPSAARA
jgi:HPt (histidine-containing phosphotransfer) domain-containing protein